MNMRKQNEGIIFNTINWLLSNIGILMYTQRESTYVYKERERERGERERGGERERVSNPV